MSIAILVPVLGRQQQIKPLLRSIAHNTTLPHRVVFICSPNDETALVCQSTKATTIMTDWEPGRADFAKKINLAYAQTEEEWLFQAATDLNFHPHWDTNALNVASNRGVGVVGTNDLGNPSVIRGKASTHTFFSRQYIEQYGGTIDGSGTVFSELYDHQFIDHEFVETAKRRQQWAFSPNSVVEHLHPVWGKGSFDATYEKAFRATAEDQQLFLQRRRSFVQARRR